MLAAQLEGAIVIRRDGVAVEYRWARGDYQPQIQKAIAIVEVARAAGRTLTLEDIYEREVTRVRVRMRSSLPPL